MVDDAKGNEAQAGAADQPLAALDPEGLKSLLAVTRRINAETNMDAILDTIVDSLVSIASADRGFLALRADDGTLRFTVARDRKGRPLEKKKFKVSMGVVDTVAQTGEAQLIDDAAATDALNARQSIISLSLRTILCVPLKALDRVTGVIYVDSNAITRRFTEGDLPLIEAFAAQAAATLERVRLQKAELERNKMAAQLAIAADIQKTFLPSEFPELPGIAGSVATVAALEVGGDFYDVIQLPGGRVGVMVGDVSGKGVPGALFGARLLSDVRHQALLTDDAAATLTAVNEIVNERSTRGMFVTLLYAVLDPATGTVQYANAGHLFPLIRRASGELEEWPKPAAMPLGILPETKYETGENQLRPGDVLVILSDGLGDAEREDGERFGDDRVREVVAAVDAGPVAVVEKLLEATAEFTGPHPQADDQTLLAVSLQ